MSPNRKIVKLKLPEEPKKCHLVKKMTNENLPKPAKNKVSPTKKIVKLKLPEESKNKMSPSKKLPKEPKTQSVI